MRCVLSYPGVMEHAQHAALALQEIGALEAFVTTFVYRQGGALDRSLALAPSGLRDKLRRELSRRAVFPELAGRTVAFGALEMVRTLGARAGAGPVWTDKVFDLAVRRFDAETGRRFARRCDVMIAFEYAAEASLAAAKAAGKAAVLHLPSLDSRAFQRIEARELAAWPELVSPHAAYFDGKFAERYARRQREIALADVIIANSARTKASHVAAGADPDKVFVVPLGAPPPIPEALPLSPDQPLTVLWSGSFSIGKGAHHLLEAWRTLGGAARLKVYGRVTAPDRLLADLPGNVELLGSRPRAEVLEAYAGADVLVFPSLSDGFGLSVAEALSRGLPAIVSDAAGAADLIERGRNGLIVPAADPAALAEALRWCLDNRPALARMRPAALASVRDRQWSDYRRNVIAATDAGLKRAGFAPLAAGVA